MNEQQLIDLLKQQMRTQVELQGQFERAQEDLSRATALATAADDKVCAVKNDITKTRARLMVVIGGGDDPGPNIDTYAVRVALR